MSLLVDVQKRLGAFAVAAAFESGGPLTVLFGRSGAGKTSIVNMIAGLTHPDRGRIVVGDRALVDTERSIRVPAHRRRVGMIFQEGRLFPHLTVRQNLAYGRWFAPARERYASFDQVVEMLGIGPLLDRRPGHLSGGEKQRVAIGRALIASPRLLLMDEPLASLDEARKAEILPYIERLRDESRVPIVYVSHSVAEVSRLASVVVLLSDGRVEEVGDPGDIMADPTLFPSLGRYEAGAMITARVVEHDSADGLSVLETEGSRLTVTLIDAPIGAHVRVRIRARDVVLALRPPEEISALNVLPVTVTEIGPTDTPMVDVQLACGSELILARITRRSLTRLAIEPGRTAYAILKTVALGRRDIGRVAARQENAGGRL